MQQSSIVAAVFPNQALLPRRQHYPLGVTLFRQTWHLLGKTHCWNQARVVKLYTAKLIDVFLLFDYDTIYIYIDLTFCLFSLWFTRDNTFSFHEIANFHCDFFFFWLLLLIFLWWTWCDDNIVLDSRWRCFFFFGRCECVVILLIVLDTMMMRWRSCGRLIEMIRWRWAKCSWMTCPCPGRMEIWFALLWRQ